MHKNNSSDLTFNKEGSCEVLYPQSITKEEVQKCVDVFLKKIVTEEASITGFQGKGQPQKVSLRPNLNLIFRRNKRGGLIGRVIRSKYMLPLSFPKNTRPFKEFQCLKNLREVGIPVPEPILAIVKKKGFVFYEGGLFTKELIDAPTLLDVVEKTDISLLRDYAYNAGLWASRALELGYLHPDLHLGNVLVRPGGITLIDFDKYRNVSDKESSRKYLQSRWDRGVEKRVKNTQTQKVLCESFLAGLKYDQKS